MRRALSARRRAAPLVVAVAAMAAAAIAVGLALGGAGFLAQHWGALAAATVFVALFATVVVRLVGGVARALAATLRRPRALGQSGAAAAEFVIVVIPFLLLLFGIMQMALASLARVLVGYSAFTAARAAIVFVPEQIGDEAPNQVGSGGDAQGDFQRSKKAALMRNAAAYAMIPASPSIDVVVVDAARNLPAYLADRIKHGFSPTDFLQHQLDHLGQQLLDSFKNKVQSTLSDIASGAISKSGALQKLDGWINGLPGLTAGEKKQLADAAQSYINAQIDNGAGAAAGQLGDWVQNTVDQTLSGQLAGYKDQIDSAIAGALGTLGSGGGSGANYSVGRALDEGFGAGTDGAGGALLRSLRKLVYARLATTVTLVDAKTGAYKSSYAWGDAITARVTFLFYCQIPLANRFAGSAFYNLPSGATGDLATGPLGPLATVGIPGNFLVLQAQHTMVNQGKP